MRFLKLLALLSLALPGIGAAADSITDRCAGQYLLTDADHAVEPGIVVQASQGTPAHCRVSGTIDGTIRFEVNMPLEGWTTTRS